MDLYSSGMICVHLWFPVSIQITIDYREGYW